MQENAQKFDCKTQPEIACNCMWLLHGKIAHLDAFSECFELEASPLAGQSLLQKDNKRRKRKGTNKCLLK